MFCKKCGKELNNGALVCPDCGYHIPIRSVIDIFRNARSIWNGEVTNNDCFAYNIPENVKSLIRQNFGISYNEQILFVRDTSFWNSRDQGLVLTDTNIYCISDNDKMDEKIVLPWSIIKQVEYKDLTLYFWGYGKQDDYRPIHISFFIKHENEQRARGIGNALAQLFSQIAQSIEPEIPPLNKVINKYNNLVNQNKGEEALQYALACKDTLEGWKIFYSPIATLYFLGKEYQKAISTCDEGLNYYERDSSMGTELLYTRYSSYQVLGNYIPARKDCLSVMKNATNEIKRNGIPIKEKASEDFKVLERKYVNNYLDLPYNERKILLPVNEYTDLIQEYLSVVNIKNLPTIDFPIGHPIAYQIYIGHPYIREKYIPFENYELELIEDKVREFCQIVQSLGATEITIECINSSTSDSNTDSEQNISAEANYRMASASGSKQKQKSRHLIDEISQSINLHQKFTPKENPALPQKLIWFPNEPSWQRLYEQRMQGSLLQHNERIETRKNRVIEGTELNAIEAEFKSLFLEAKGHWDKKDEEKFELQENAILSIQVQFASLVDLNQTNISSQYTVKEQEYLEEVKSCMEGDTEISVGERRLLEKLRKHLDISEERAKELEEILFLPLLENNEVEYWEEVRFCLENSNEISEKERRLLDKLRKSLNISESRATEIERYSKISTKHT